MTGAIRGYLRSFTGFGHDARVFLLITIVFGSAQGLFWLDFNLYLESIGIDAPTIGLLMATQQLAGVIAAFPASALSNRFGRRKVMGGGIALVAVALFTILQGSLGLIFLGTAAMGAGSMAFGVVQVPFIAEHTNPDQRNEFFAIWNALAFLTGVVAALAGGAMATIIADALSLHSGSAPYVVLLTGVAVLGLLSLVTIAMLTDDTPRGPRQAGKGASRFGIVISDRRLFVRLLLPGFLTALGAGQLIPFLNVFIQVKFTLDLTAVNAVFAVSNLGTAFAIMLQPAIARRYGRIASVVLVQGVSIPFLIVLGFSPVLWSVVLALAVRNSLMNAGSPIWDAYVMDRVTMAERATLSAAMTLLWSLGWTIAPLYYSQLQATLGFTAGYAVDFVTIIVLYSVATSLLWHWFHGPENVQAEDRTAADAALAGAALPGHPEPAAPLTDQV